MVSLFMNKQAKINVMSNLKTAHVIFENSDYNYSTSVNGSQTDQEIKDYFIGTSFNVAAYPNEVFEKCIDCKVEPFKE